MNRIKSIPTPRTLLALAVACAIQMSPSEASAQGDTSSSRTLEEVIITAQKREQSILDVGITVAVASEDEIRQRRIVDVTDITLFTPNATVKEFVPGLMPIITIRGVGLNDFNAANNPATGVYIDELSLSSLALLSSDFYDLERMEVLKGPQGTLYGRNSIAGALNITTIKPSFDGTSGRLQGGVGDYELAELEGAVNVPINDRLAVRLAAKGIDQGEGFYKNNANGDDIGKREVLMGRAQLLWAASDSTDVLFKAESQRARSELGSPEFFGALPTAETSDCPGKPQCSNFLGYSDNDGDPFSGDWSVDPDYKFNQQIYTLRVDSDLGFAQLTSVTGYIDFDRSYASDVDASPFRTLDFYNSDDVQQFSQELRLFGDSDLLIWQAGVFYANDQIKTTYDGDLQDLLSTTTESKADLEATSMAAFANGEWSLTDTLSLITGLRYTKEEKSNEGYTDDLVTVAPASGLSGAPVGSGPLTLASVDESIDDDSVDWKLGLNWQAGDDALVYMSVSQGTKSGGFFTGVATTSEQLQPYKKEQLLAYELGVKGESADVGLTYEAAVFYYDYNDIQTYISDNSGAIPIQRLGNISGGDITGADLLVTWLPASLDGLRFSLGAGYLDTELDSFAAASGVVPKGNELPDAPEWSGSVDVRYRFDLSGNNYAELGVDAQYQEEVFRDALNDPLLQSDSYWVINARASVYLDDVWEFSLWGKNLDDEEYVSQGINQLALGNGYRAYGAPRTYGFTVTRMFE
jgi:iron complex outermembrane receptor protein